MILVRYPNVFHSILLGQRPLIVTGQAFKGIAKADCGMRPFERMLAPFVKELRIAAQQLVGETPEEARRLLATLLLQKNIVSAFWITHVPEENTLPSANSRLELCIAELARQIPVDWHGSPADDTLELLDGLSSPEHYTAYFNQHDTITLEQQIVVIV